MSKELCKICKKNNLDDFFEKSMCMYCGEPFCAQCVDVQVTSCPCCKRNLNDKSDKSIMKSLLRIEEKIKKGEIEKPERILSHLYICLAGRYLKAQGCKKNLKKAIDYYEKSSKLGNTVADYNLYCIYYDQEKSETVYNSYLERAVESGYPKALCTKALSLKCDIDPLLALHALDMRSALAKKKLYQYFRENPEVTTTEIGMTEEAISLLERSVRGKYSDALFEWAVAIQFGHIPSAEITSDMSEEEVNQKIDLNARKAVMWYKLAAEQGHSLAMNNLGVIFKNGLGKTSPDLEEAYRWYFFSHESGCTHGTFGLGTVWEEKGENLKIKSQTGIFTSEELLEMQIEKEECYREAGRYYGYACQKLFTPAIFQLGFLMVTRRLPDRCLVGEKEIEYKHLEMIKDGIELINDAANRGNRHAQRYLQSLKKEVDLPGDEEGPLTKQIYNKDETVVYPTPIPAFGTQS